MEWNVRQRRAVCFISAFVLTTMLILGFNARWSSAPGIMHSRDTHRLITSHCRIADPGCNIGIKPRLHAVPLIHDLMTSAISMADRL